MKEQNYLKLRTRYACFPPSNLVPRVLYFLPGRCDETISSRRSDIKKRKQPWDRGCPPPPHTPKKGKMPLGFANSFARKK